MSEKTVYLIQHPAGYSNEYESRARMLAEAGFIRCRSEPGPDGKHWEVWLGYDWMLKEPIQGGGKARVVRWLTSKVGPGEIAVAVEAEHWGLGPD